MGTLDVGSYAPIVAALPLVAVAFAMVATLPRPLDLISLGADAAAAPRRRRASGPSGWRSSARRSRPAPRCRSAGPVAFIGLVVPHLVRLVVGSDHRLVLPASALFGAAFLIACDLVARTLFAPLELPVGIVTARHRRTVLPVAARQEVRSR